MKNFSWKKIKAIAIKNGFTDSYSYRFSNESKIIVKIKIYTLREICTITKNHQRIYVENLFLHKKEVENLKLEINMAKTNGTLLSVFPDSIENGNGELIVKRNLPIDINTAQIYRTGSILTIELNEEFFKALGELTPYKEAEIRNMLNKMAKEIERKFVKKNPFSKKPISTLIIED